MIEVKSAVIPAKAGIQASPYPKVSSPRVSSSVRRPSHKGAKHLLRRNDSIKIWLLVSGIWFLSWVSLPHMYGADVEKDPFWKERQEMVEWQIAARGVHDPRVLEAMRNVPRHEFVPEGLRRLAYYDGPLSIGEEQTISQPYIVALMTELLGLKPGEKVLEIGTGSGYQAAVLAEITDQVYTIEILEPLYQRAGAKLKELGYTRVRLKWGDGTLGWPEHAPFDKIIVTAAAFSDIPRPLMEQLKEGGIIVIPIGTWYQDLIVATKKNGQLIRRNVIPVRFVPLLEGKEAEKAMK